MFLDDLTKGGVIGAEGGDQCGDRGKATNMDIGDTAIAGFFSLGVVGEEGPMIFLEIGIAMPTWGAEEVDIEIEPEVWGVGLLSEDLFVKFDGELKIEGIFAGLKLGMIMSALDAPVDRLIVKNFPEWI